jgi:hypothetical protein
MATDAAMDSRTFNVHPNNTSTATVRKIMHNIVRMAYRLIMTRFNTARAMLMETPVVTRVSCDNVRCRSYNSRSPTNQPFLIPGWDSESYLFAGLQSLLA